MNPKQTECDRVVFAAAPPTANLNLSALQTKSRWGGKRTGAGRKRGPNSIRSKLAHNSYTRFQTHVRDYVEKHGSSSLNLLLNTRRISFRFAYRLAHLDVDAQERFFIRCGEVT
jgi:hypothetical protein